MATENNTEYLTVFPCGHLIKEIVKDSHSRGRWAIATVEEPTTKCCGCRKEHYLDCGHRERGRVGISLASMEREPAKALADLRRKRKGKIKR